MDGRKQAPGYRPTGSGGAPVSDTRGGGGPGGTGGGTVGQRYMAGGGRNGVRGDRRLKDRDGRDNQRMRSGRGRPDYREGNSGGNSSSLMMKTPVILARDKRAEPPTMLPPGPVGVSIMQRESSGSHLPNSPPISHPSTSSSSGGLFSPRGETIPTPSGGGGGHHHGHHNAPLPVAQSKSHEDRGGRNHRKQDGVTSSPSSYTPLQPGMRGSGGREGGGGHARSTTSDHSVFHSQTNEMTHALKLIDRNLHWEDKAVEFLLEQSDYLVVGVLGKQGVGKSTLMSLLAGTRTGATKPFMFRTQSKEVYESGGYHTAGVEVMVTAERIILLDSQPILSDTMHEQLCQNPNSVPRDMSPSTYLQLVSLQLAMFLYSVCHMVIVVVDSLDSPDVLFQFLWTVEQMKTNCLRPSLDSSEMPDKGPKEYFPQVAFLLNHASPDHFQPYSIRDTHLILAEQFRGAKFSINGGISLYKSGVVPIGKGFPVRKGPKSNDNIDPADVNFYLLPTNQNASDNFGVYTASKPENGESNLNPVLRLLPSYSGHPNYTLLAETLRNQVFSMPRPPICRTTPQQQQQQQQLTEREWFDYARRIWMTLRKTDLVSEYDQIVQDSSSPN